MKFVCHICNQTLFESDEMAVCSFCGAEEDAVWICSQKHFICQKCRMAEAAELIEKYCNYTPETNPFVIADLIMHHPGIASYGIQHHWVVAPSALAALRNLGYIQFDANKMKALINRMDDLPFGVCGNRGDCGASLGAGIAMSAITELGFHTDKERSLMLETTARALLKLSAMPGVRCCKQSVYCALESVNEILHNYMGFGWTNVKPVCTFSSVLKDCKTTDCPYHQT